MLMIEREVGEWITLKDVRGRVIARIQLVQVKRGRNRAKIGIEADRDRVLIDRGDIVAGSREGAGGRAP